MASRNSARRSSTTDPPVPKVEAAGRISQAQAVADPLAVWRKAAERGYSDPVWWIAHVLRVTLYGKQPEVARAILKADRVAVKSGHGVGKGIVSACLAVWWFLVRRGMVLVAAPTWAQVEDIWFDRLRRVLSTAILPAAQTDDLQPRKTEWRLGPEWCILGVNSDRPENIHGYHAERLLLIADEAAGIEDPFFEAFEGAQVSRGVGEAKILMLGNPTRLDGYFGAAFAPGSDWRTLTISALDSPNVTGQAVVGGMPTPEWIAEREAEWGRDSNAFRVRVLGEFPLEGGVDRIVPEAILLAAIEADPPDVGERHSCVQGLDVARFGDDASVSVIIRDGVVEDIAEVNGYDTVRVAEWAAERAERFGCLLTVTDETGVGGGVVDQTRRTGVDVRGVVFSEKPRRPKRHANRRTELISEVVTGLREGRLVLPRHEKMLTELRALRYSVNRAGAVVLEEKKLTKQRLGRSPDCADALSLAWDGYNLERSPTPQEVADAAATESLKQARRRARRRR